MNALTIINLVNEERAHVRLPALKNNEDLAQAAQKKTEDMKAKEYFAHQDSAQQTITEFIPKSYPYSLLGENLGFGFANEKELVKAWMKSSSHKSNMLDPTFVDVGIGVTPVDGRFLVAEVFGTTQQDFLARKKDLISFHLDVSSILIALTIIFLGLGLLTKRGGKN